MRVKFKNKQFIFTNEGFVKYNNYFIGLNKNNKIEYHTNYKYCLRNLNPICTEKLIKEINGS